jgi:hypothetical protein
VIEFVLVDVRIHVRKAAVVLLHLHLSLKASRPANKVEETVAQRDDALVGGVHVDSQVAVRYLNCVLECPGWVKL